MVSRVLQQPSRGMSNVFQRRADVLSEWPRCRIAIGFYERKEPIRCLTDVTQQFPTDEVKCVHPVCAFVDHGYARIAHVLFHPPLGDVTMPPKHLLHGYRCFEPSIGAERL